MGFAFKQFDLISYCDMEAVVLTNHGHGGLVAVLESQQTDGASLVEWKWEVCGNQCRKVDRTLSLEEKLSVANVFLIHQISDCKGELKKGWISNEDRYAALAKIELANELIRFFGA